MTTKKCTRRFFWCTIFKICLFRTPCWINLISRNTARIDFSVCVRVSVTTNIKKWNLDEPRPQSLIKSWNCGKEWGGRCLLLFSCLRLSSFLQPVVDFLSVIRINRTKCAQVSDFTSVPVGSNDEAMMQKMITSMGACHPVIWKKWQRRRRREEKEEGKEEKKDE